MKSWYKSLLDIVNEYHDYCVAFNNAKDELDEQLRKGIIGGVLHLEKKRELEEMLLSYQDKQREAVERVRKNAYVYIQRRYGLHGANLTPDAQMFTNDQINFTESEIKRYIDQYKNNPTMTRIISEYCSRHNLQIVGMPFGIMSAEGIRKDWDDNCNMAAGCMNNGSPLYVALAIKALEDHMKAALDTIEED